MEKNNYFQAFQQHDNVHKCFLKSAIKLSIRPLAIWETYV